MSSTPVANQAQSFSEQKLEPYWHLHCRPHVHMVSLLEVLAMHFGKPVDDVADIIANDSPLVDVLLADWSSKFRTQRALVHSALSEWARSYLHPKRNEEMPGLEKKQRLHGDLKEKYPRQAAQSFCFMPFGQFAFGYDYDYLKNDCTSQYSAEIVAAVKNDYEISIKYPHLPLFGAAIWPYEVDYWPIEMIHVSVAVPLMLNLM